MTRLQFVALPLALAFLLLAAVLCWAAEWRPITSTWQYLHGEAHQFAREMGGR